MKQKRNAGFRLFSGLLAAAAVCLSAGSACAQETSDAASVRDGLVLIPGGTFTMGSPAGERQRHEDERAHRVALSPFYLSPYEVTQAEYESVMGANPSHFTGDNLPVETVTWYDAAAYCNALSEREGLTPAYTVSGNTVSWNRAADGYRLPTEAEWEYAARAGTTGVFPWGDRITSDNANFEGTYPYLIEENYVNRQDPTVRSSRNRNRTVEVDELEPNGFGLYNMHGNVSEWCFDYYGEYGEETGNPAGARSGSLRVNRGGGWNDFGKQLRSAYRSAAAPDTTDWNLGFRVARNAEPGSGTVTTTYTANARIPENPRILIAYFSYTGNTENAAEIIAEATDADVFDIRMAEPYRGGIYDVSQRDLNAGARPALAGRVQNMAQYDVVLLGYPTWWSTMPMPVYTFLESYDFSDKVILPFSSHGGTRFGDSISDLSKTARGAYVGQGFEFEYSGGRRLEDNLRAWLAGHGIAVR